MPNEVSITWADPEPVPNNPGRWRVRVTVCNLTNQDLPILVADNPWSDNADPTKPYETKLLPGVRDENGKYTRESMIRAAKAAGKSLTLKPAGQADACRSLVFEYPWRPLAAYTDVYRRKPDGTVSDAPLPGGAGTHFFPTLETGMLDPDGERPTYACVIPFPYPASVETAHGGPIDVAITRVEGVPRGLKLLATAPALRQRVRLGCGDRRSQAVVLLQHVGDLQTGARHVITVHQKVLNPAKVRRWPIRTVSFVVTGPASPRRKKPRPQAG